MKWALVLAMLGVRVASAAVVQVPEGGKPVAVIGKGVVCGPLLGGWTIDAADRRMVVPPPATATSIARTLDVKVADSVAACAASKQTVTLIALGVWPDIDTASVVFYPDEGRLELKGQRLKGVQVAWSVPAIDKTPAKQGAEACIDPGTAKTPTCAFPLPAGLPADATLYWLPAFGKLGDDVITYDGFGSRVERDALRLRPARVVLSKPLVQSGGVDITNGPARVAVSHPEVVSTVECGNASCELADGAITVRGVPTPLVKVTLRVRLAPRVFAARQGSDAVDTVVTTTLPILSCPMTVVAGSVVRDVDDPSAVVKLDPSCTRDPNALRWLANSEQAEIHRVVKTTDGTYVLLRILRVTSERITITAARPELDNSIVASATGKTSPLPFARVSLQLEAHGKIDFIPTNRDAAIVVASIGETGVLVPVSVPSVYTVTQAGGKVTIRAAENTEGFASLQLAYRLPTLPGELASADLAMITEHVQRAVREAAVPAPIGASAYQSREPLVELLCGDQDGKPQRVEPGKRHRIPFSARDSCRVVLHGERLQPADGGQEITLDIEVFKADNTPRGEAKVSEHMVLRPGTNARVIPVKGGLGQFDRIEVRVSHVVDESRYVVTSTPSKPGLLAAQWSAIVDGGRFRLYATATIPAGLYRVNSPSGQLTLNFGVLSRLTTLNREGKEGLFGLELGVMGLALVPQQSNVIFPITLAIVTGAGFRVPLGQGATLGVQGYVAREFRDGPIKVRNPDGTTMEQAAGNWSFIFGPSISFGNVGLNL